MVERRQTDGFAAYGIVVAVVVIAFVVFAGWYAIHSHDTKKTNTTTSSSQNKSTPKKTTTPSKTATSTTKSSPSPILGESWAPTQQGYGTVEPSTINNGGDPTGTVTNVTWQSWGGSQATGTGMSTYVAPNGTVSDGTQEQVSIVAFNLGTCQGNSAYTAIEWYFPQHGGSFNPNQYRNICTGQEVGQ